MPLMKYVRTVYFVKKGSVLTFGDICPVLTFGGYLYCADFGGYLYCSDIWGISVLS
ncbi:unnamed protein product [Staurois parvus]|uniref:Uncharacterized protein n=1 Tax=Staurois parvus TaxID=386267 RepID=A0ABN9B8G5_9NEOB|nr:unnamed protein product [Staurois parvus]